MLRYLLLLLCHDLGLWYELLNRLLEWIVHDLRMKHLIWLWHLSHHGCLDEVRLVQTCKPQRCRILCSYVLALDKWVYLGCHEWWLGHSWMILGLWLGPTSALTIKGLGLVDMIIWLPINCLALFTLNATFGLLLNVGFDLGTLGGFDPILTSLRRFLFCRELSICNARWW